jgi:hypothetical protein
MGKRSPMDQSYAEKALRPVGFADRNSTLRTQDDTLARKSAEGDFPISFISSMT